MAEKLPIESVVVKNNRVRLCAIIPISIDIGDQGSQFDEFVKELCCPSNASSQASMVTKITSCGSGGDALIFKSSVNILVRSLLQCPLKSNLATKITRCIQELKLARPLCFLQGFIASLQQAQADLNHDNYGPLCHILLIIPKCIVLAQLFNNSDEASNIFAHTCCHDHDKEKLTQLDVRVELLEDILGQYVALHLAICKLFHCSLFSLQELAFSDKTRHLQAAASQQSLQQLISCLLQYMQALSPSHAQVNQLQIVFVTNTKQIVQLRPHTFCNEFLLKIAETVVAILMQNSLLLDLRLVCGQMLAVLPSVCMSEFDHLPSEEQEDVKEEVSCSLKPFSNVFLHLPELGRFAVLHGLLCVVPAEKLFITSVNGTVSISCSKSLQPAGLSLGCFLIQEILSCSRDSSNAEIVLSCSRLLNHWTLRVLAHEQNCLRMCQVVPVNSPFEELLLGYIWFTWEHYLDRIKHITFETFINFLEIRRRSLNVDSHKYFMQLFRKLVVLIPEKKYAINAVQCLVKYISVQEILDCELLLVHKLVNCLGDFSRAGSAAEALKAIFSKHATETDSGTWQNFWIPLIFNAFHADMMSFGFEALVSDLFQANQSSLSFAINYVLSVSSGLTFHRSMLLISCVKAARSCRRLHSCVTSFSKANRSMPTWRDLLPYYVIESFLSHPDERLQVSAFGLICNSPKSTEDFELNELRLVLYFLQRCLGVDGAAQRQAIVTICKKFLNRLKDSTNSLLKQDVPECVREEWIRLLADFCVASVEALVRQLNSQSSYSRRCCALLILEQFVVILQEANLPVRKALNIDNLFAKPWIIFSLIERLGDCYDNIKAIALELLKRNMPNVKNLFVTSPPVTTINAIRLANSCRPAETLSAAYLARFLCASSSIRTIPEFESWPSSLMMCYSAITVLENHLNDAVKDLLTASVKKPIHGHLTVIRCVLADVTVPVMRTDRLAWVQFISKLINECFKAHEIVRAVVENESPEGNVPMDFSVAEELANYGLSCGDAVDNCDSLSDIFADDANRRLKVAMVSAQMLLLCSWRTVKEVSLLFGQLVSGFPLPPATDSVLSPLILAKIFNYFLTVLLTTKHRGAFEQTYSGFLKVCQTVWLSEPEHFGTLPNSCVNNVLADIQKESEERFCATRRSAGIPFIVQAVLETEPTSREGACLKSTFETLLHFATHSQFKDTYTRVHSFNILRALYKNTKLGDVIVPYVARGAMAAIEGFNSSWWPVRNSATLLYAALINRMLGVKRNKDDLHSKNSVSGVVFFKRYPELFEFMFSKLNDGVRENLTGGLASSVYPVLLLLARLLPSPLHSVTTNVSLQRFSPYVIFFCSESRIFQLRTLAARALVPLVSMANLESIIDTLCTVAFCHKKNAVHGSLVAIRQLLMAYVPQATAQSKVDILKCLADLTPLATSFNMCPIAQAAAIDIFTLILEKKLLSVKDSQCVFIKESVIAQLYHISNNMNRFQIIPGVFSLERSIISFSLCFFNLSEERNEDELSNFIEFCLSKACAEQRKATVEVLTAQRKLLPLKLMSKFEELITHQTDPLVRIALFDLALVLLRTARRLISKGQQDLRGSCTQSSGDTVGIRSQGSGGPHGCDQEENTFEANVVEFVRRRPLHNLLYWLQNLLYSEDEGLLQEEECGHAIPLLLELFIQTNQIRHEEHVTELCRRLDQWSDCTRHSSVREGAAIVTAALISRRLAATAVCKQPFNHMDGDPLLRTLLECACSHLRDDDLQVRTEAAKIWSTLLTLAAQCDPSRPGVQDYLYQASRLSAFVLSQPNELGGNAGGTSSASPHSVSALSTMMRDLQLKHATSPSKSSSLSLSKSPESTVQATQNAANRSSNLDGSHCTGQETVGMVYCEAALIGILKSLSIVGLPGAMDSSTLEEYWSLMSTVRPEQVMEALCHFMGGLGDCESVSLLVSIALREVDAADDYLTLDGDRAFDRSEVSLRSEQLREAELAGLALASVRSDLRQLILNSAVVGEHIFAWIDHPFAVSMATATFSDAEVFAHEKADLEHYPLTVTRLLDKLTIEMFGLAHMLECLKFSDVSSRLTRTDKWLARLAKCAIVFRALQRDPFHDYSIARISCDIYTAEALDHASNPAGSRYDPFYFVKKVLLSSPLDSLSTTSIVDMIRAADEREITRERYKLTTTEELDSSL